MKSHYGPKFGGMMQFTLQRIILWNDHTQLMFAFSDLGEPRVLLFCEHFVVIAFVMKMSFKFVPYGNFVPFLVNDWHEGSWQAIT